MEREWFASRCRLVFSTDASCADEPRAMVGDGQDTEQLFGVDVDLDLNPQDLDATTNAAGLDMDAAARDAPPPPKAQHSAVQSVVLSAADLGYPVANLTDIPLGVKYCVQVRSWFRPR